MITITDRLAEALRDIAGALDTTLLHSKDMPSGDLRSRRALVTHAEAVLAEYDGRAQQEADAGGVTALPETVRTTALHIGKVIDYIEKQYPGAAKLDAEPIMRNLRRWNAALTAALTPEVRHGD